MFLNPQGSCRSPVHAGLALAHGNLHKPLKYYHFGLGFIHCFAETIWLKVTQAC